MFSASLDTPVLSNRLFSLPSSPLLVGQDGLSDPRGRKSAILSIHKPGFVFGDRRDATVQLLSEVYAQYGQDGILASLRKAFAPIRPIASHPAVAIGYNIAV